MAYVNHPSKDMNVMRSLVRWKAPPRQASSSQLINTLEEYIVKPAMRRNKIVGFRCFFRSERFDDVLVQLAARRRLLELELVKMIEVRTYPLCLDAFRYQSSLSKFPLSG